MKKGFTLIELLVVLAIIGILAAMIIASLSTARARARDATRKSDLRQVKTALEQYYNDQTTAQYPPATTAINVNTDLFGTNNPLEGYMKAVIDPQNVSPKIYMYKSSASPYTSYVLYTGLENVKEADTAGVTCLSAGGGSGTCTSTDKYFQVSSD